MKHERAVHSVSKDKPLHPGHFHFRFQKSNGTVVYRCRFKCAKEFSNSDNRNAHEISEHDKPSKKEVVAPEDRLRQPCLVSDCKAVLHDKPEVKKHLRDTPAHHDHKDMKFLLELDEALKTAENKRTDEQRDCIKRASDRQREYAPIWERLYNTSNPDDRFEEGNPARLPPLGLGKRMCNHGCGKERRARQRATHRKNWLLTGSCTVTDKLIKENDTKGLGEVRKRRKNRDPRYVPPTTVIDVEAETGADTGDDQQPLDPEADVDEERDRDSQRRVAASSSSLSASASASASALIHPPMTKAEELADAVRLQARLEAELRTVNQRIQQLQSECGAVCGNPNGSPSSVSTAASASHLVPLTAVPPLPHYGPPLTPAPFVGNLLGDGDTASIASHSGRSLSDASKELFSSSQSSTNRAFEQYLRRDESLSQPAAPSLQSPRTTDDAIAASADDPVVVVATAAAPINPVVTAALSQPDRFAVEPKHPVPT